MLKKIEFITKQTAYYCFLFLATFFYKNMLYGCMAKNSGKIMSIRTSSLESVLIIFVTGKPVDIIVCAFDLVLRLFTFWVIYKIEKLHFFYTKSRFHTFQNVWCELFWLCAFSNMMRMWICMWNKKTRPHLHKLVNIWTKYRIQHRTKTNSYKPGSGFKHMHLLTYIGRLWICRVS